MAQETQSLKNHARWVPAYHFVLSPVLLILFLYAAVQLFRQPSLDALFNLLLVITLFMTALYARLFPLAAQDRLIRLEMYLRLEKLLPAELYSRLDEIPPKRFVALRFAGDEDLPQLIQGVLDGKLATDKDIKQKITHWKTDNFRV